MATSMTTKASNTIRLNKIGGHNHIIPKEKTQIPEYYIAIGVSD